MRILILLSALTGAKTFQLSGGLGIAPSAKSFLSNGVLHQSPRKACWPLCSSATETGTGAKLSKLETLKTESGYLTQPLDSEIRTEETLSVTPNAMQILKYHGSYQQTNRELKGVKDYQFMLRLKQPCGELKSDVYRLLDDLSAKYGQGDLRATTRQCFQLHGVRKATLKTVVSSLLDIGSSTVGACGDVSRNVMVTPAPFVSPSYVAARKWGKIIAQLFRPMTGAFSTVWLDGEKAATVESWAREVEAEGIDVDKMMRHDRGTGIVLDDHVEPLYGDRYLPRKFKVGITVPGDNSLDLYTNDIGLVVVSDGNGNPIGFNVMVGGGMGRTHRKEETFARVADHMGYVPFSKAPELLKSILAAQRDHGNRDVRANARMKYLVHTLGIDNFKRLVESYFGEEVEEWRDVSAWKYSDWMGWWEQGDGKLFYGLHVDCGRVKDFEDGPQLKTVMRKLVDKYDLDIVMSPTQSLILKDIKPEWKDDIEEILHQHGVLKLEEIDSLQRLGMACPALPLCGLAVTEAERRFPEYIEKIRGLLVKAELPDEEIMIRMTGCPNGCARPYMAELAFVGDSGKSYQVWVGGSPVLEGRTGFVLKDKVKEEEMDTLLGGLFGKWRDTREGKEAFGDWAHRLGQDQLLPP